MCYAFQTTLLAAGFMQLCHTRNVTLARMSHKQNFTNRIVPRLRYHTRLHTMLPPCYSQLVLCTVIHSTCVPHYTIGSWFYAIVFFNHVHNPMDHDTNIMCSKLHYWQLVLCNCIHTSISTTTTCLPSVHITRYSCAAM